MFVEGKQLLQLNVFSKQEEGLSAQKNSIFGCSLAKHVCYLATHSDPCCALVEALEEMRGLSRLGVINPIQRAKFGLTFVLSVLVS